MLYLKIMKQSILPLAAFLALILLGACTPTIASRGHKLSDADMATLKPGMSQDDIIKAIGTPTSQSAFDAHEWYYVSERTEQTAFFSPETKERAVTVLKFDNNDALIETHTLTKKDGQTVAMDKDITPTSGEEYTILQQLLGNLGKFNNPSQN